MENTAALKEKKILLSWLVNKSTRQKRRSKIHRFLQWRQKNIYKKILCPHLFRFLFSEYIWLLDQAVMGGTGFYDLHDTLKKEHIWFEIIKTYCYLRSSPKYFHIKT